jgi:2-methylcitrate dehydratase PrpD
MEDGRVFTSKADIPKGDPLRKLTKDEIQAKFRNLVQPLIGNDKTEHLIRSIEHLEKLGDVTDLLE